MKKHYKWKIGTINVRTCKDDHKLEHAVQEIHKANLEICALQEVRRLKQGSAIVECGNTKYEIHWSGHSLKRQHGVGFVVKVDPNVELDQVEYLDARIVVLQARVYGCLLKVINCYAPTEDSGDSSKELFYKNLKKQCSNVPPKYKVICLGDFNATTSASWYNSSLRENSIIEDLTVNNNGERFHNLIQTQHLSALNTWFNHKRCRRITWHSPDGKTKKVYDFILCCSWLRQFTTNCRVYNSFDFDSDHRLVIAHMNTPGNKLSRAKKRKPKHTRKKLNFKMLETDEVRKNLISKFSNSWENIQLTNLNNSNINDLIINKIETATTDILPETIEEKLHQPWQNDDQLRELYTKKDELLKKNADREIMQRLRKKIRKRSRYLRNEHFKSEALKLDILATSRELDKLFTSAKRQTTTLKSSNNSSSCPPDDILNHFKRHFNPDNNADRPGELDDVPNFVESLRKLSSTIDINSEPPTIDEISKHLQKLKNKRANNDIDSELLKNCECPTLLNAIHQMTLNVWENLDIPSSWGNSRLKTLWKGKGSKKDASKYRGLSIGSTICKLIVNIILSRLQPWYETQLSDEQNGFRLNRGTTDGIYNIKRIQQISNRKMQPLYLVFIDLSAAFDHIPRKWLFDSIRLRFENNQNKLLIDILEKLYENTSLTFEETTFETTSGVRQGGPESPNLFNLYIDFVMRVFLEKSQNIKEIQFFDHKYRLNSRSITREQRAFMRNNGLQSWGTSEIPWSGYADDLVLYLLSLEGLQKCVELLDEIFSVFGLTINNTKTETMILNADVVLPSIAKLRGVDLKNVSMFRYLGAYINCQEPNTGDSEINQRIQLACVKFAELSNLLQNFHINLRTRILFLNCFVRTRLTYACQNWCLTTNQLDRLDITYRTFLRRMVRNGFKRIDRENNDFRLVITNANLHSLCGTRDISEFIQLQQSHYTAHVIRMPNERSLKQLMFNDDACRRRGRPHKTLLEQVLINENISLDEFCNRSLNKRV